MNFLKQKWEEANKPDPIKTNVEMSGHYAYLFADSYFQERERKNRMIEDRIIASGFDKS